MAAVGQDLPGQGQGQDQNLAQGNGKPEWKDRELELREREVSSGRASIVVQFVVAIVALGTVIVALFAVRAAREAVDATREGIERQGNEDRLSTAIQAIGGDQPGERVGGLALLRRHVANQLSDANEEGTDQKRLEAHLLYTTALRVFENYLRHPPDDQAEGGGGLGSGTPEVPTDNIYAARELQGMMRLKSQVEKLDLDALHIDRALYPRPTLDLSNAQLRGQSWREIDFSWLDDGHNFVGIDLRGANLAGSTWGTSSLEKAFLQCADLDGARFMGTDLRGADLRGANISDANFTGAQVDDQTDFDHVYYDGNRPPKGLAEVPPITQPGEWEGPQECILRPEYRAEQKGAGAPVGGQA
jgi:uncharacterized protein YjbI with pentapeptide repeats